MKATSFSSSIECDQLVSSSLLDRILVNFYHCFSGVAQVSAAGNVQFYHVTVLRRKCESKGRIPRECTYLASHHSRAK